MEERVVRLVLNCLPVLIDSLLVFPASGVNHTEAIARVRKVGGHRQGLSVLRRRFLVVALPLIGHAEVMLEPAVVGGQLNRLAVFLHGGSEFVLVCHCRSQGHMRLFGIDEAQLVVRVCTTGVELQGCGKCVCRFAQSADGHVRISQDVVDRRFILDQLCSLLQFFYRFGVFLFLKIDGSKSVARGAVVGLEPEHSLEVLGRRGRFSLLRVDHAEPVMSGEVGRLRCDCSFVGILRFFAILADQEDLSQLVERRRIVGGDLQYSLKFCLCLLESIL